MGEFELIQHFFKAATCAIAKPEVVLGIGDDCALLKPNPHTELAISVDTLVGGSHFPLHSDPFLIGQRVLATTASDLAAMGAKPLAFTLALTLPSVDEQWLAGFAKGLAAKAVQCDLALIGGDTTKGALSMSVTVFGEVPQGKALQRNGAKVGDLLCVSGVLGSAAGAVPMVLNQMPGQAELLEQYWSPIPQLSLGLLLRDKATACLDISDGLVADCGHIAEASQVALRINAEDLPANPALASVFNKAECLELMLSGGDDYQLAFTLPKQYLAELQQQYSTIQVIGCVEQGAGVTVFDANNHPIVLTKTGFKHF